MNLKEATKNYAHLVTSQGDYINDLAAKYGILADNYIVSGTVTDLGLNKKDIASILSDNIVTLMIFLYTQGRLNDAVSKNPNLRQFLDPSNVNSVTKVALNLKRQGWPIRDTETLEGLQQTLTYWGVKEVSDIDGVDDIDLSSIVDGEGKPPEPDVVDKIDFDDEGLFGDFMPPDEFGDKKNNVGDQGEPAPITPPSDLDTPQPEDKPNVTVSSPIREITAERELTEDEKAELEKQNASFRYNQNIVNAESSDNKTVAPIGDTLEDDGKSKEVEDWANDRLNSTADDFRKADIEVSSEIDALVLSIMQRIEGAIRGCYELDRAYGVLTKDGIMKYHTDKDTKKLRIDSARSQNGRSEAEQIYNAIISSAGVDLVAAPHAKMVPNYANITGKSSYTGSAACNYYPSFMLKMAIGFVNGTRYRSWSTAEKALREYLRNKLLDFYNEDIDAFYSFKDKLVEIYSNVLLVLDYSASGMKIRTSIVNMRQIDQSLASILHSIPSMTNCDINVFPVKGCKDVVDVQITRDLEAVLGKPSWAYKALRVMIDNGEDVSLTSGIPMGMLPNGDMVRFQCTTENFATFIAAGSRSGKGVLTLSLVAAALGSGMPVMYMDYKPDMAPIFWEMTRGKGIETYSFDAAVPYHKKDPETGFELGSSIPEGIRTIFKKDAGALLYLRGLELMCALAKYRHANGIVSPAMLFIFDEIQAMQRKIKAAFEHIQQQYDANKPGTKDVKTDQQVFEYAEKLLNWGKSVDQEFGEYYTTYGGVANIFMVVIGQNATAEFWNAQDVNIKVGKGVACKFFSRTLKESSSVKILGRGTVSGSGYGIKSGSITAAEKDRIANYRYFGTYKGSTSDGIDVTVFKPFLTLNYSDIFTSCWTNGVGRTYGYKPPTDGQDAKAANQEYIQNMQNAFPGEPGLTMPEYGTHVGVGLEGLASMYCGGNQAKINAALASSWESIKRFFESTGLIARYATPADYMYDMSDDAWLSAEDICNYTGTSSLSSVSSVPDDGDTDLLMEEEPVGGAPASGAPAGGAAPISQPVSESDDFFDEEDEGESGDTGQPIVPPEVAERMAAMQELERQRQAAQAAQSAQEVKSTEQGQDLFGDDFNFEAPYNDVPQMSTPFQPQQPIQTQPIQQNVDPDVAARQAAADAERARLAQQLLAGMGSPDIEKMLEEQGLESLGTPFDASEAEAQPDISSPNQHKTLQQVGRNIVCTPDNIAKMWGLPKDNAVLAKMPEYDTNEKFGRTLFKSLWGTQYEFKNRWKAILNSVAGKINPSLVTRALITESIIQFNQTQVATYNILGGVEDIRIEDIADFKMTAKKFPNIKHLRLDEELFAKANIDYGDAVAGLFSNFSRLQLLEVLQSRSGARINAITRNEFEQDRINAQMAELQERTQMKQQMEVVAAAKNTNLRAKSPGYQNRVYTTCKSIGGNSWGAARDAMMEKNPRLLRATKCTVIGLGCLAVGAVTGLFGKVASLVKR